MSITGTGVYCNTRIEGGGEQSARWIAGRLGAPLISLSNSDWKNTIAEKQIWYMNDSVYKLKDDEDFQKIIRNAYVILNFVNGGIHKLAWLRDRVRKFFFLNNDKMNGFQSACVPELKEIPKVVLPPPVDVKKYMLIEREYNRNPVVIGRHSRISLKYPKQPERMYEILAEKLPRAEFHFQIAHPAIIKRFKDNSRFRFYSWNEKPVTDFLENIDIYLSIINPNTNEQGPRTLIEAMSSGLPCIAENRDGMKDRMINGHTGFLVSDENEAIDKTVLLYNDKQMMCTMGMNARNIAETFNPELWIKEINHGDNMGSKNNTYKHSKQGNIYSCYSN